MRPIFKALSASLLLFSMAACDPGDGEYTVDVNVSGEIEHVVPTEDETPVDLPAEDTEATESSSSEAATEEEEPGCLKVKAAGETIGCAVGVYDEVVSFVDLAGRLVQSIQWNTGVIPGGLPSGRVLYTDSACSTPQYLNMWSLEGSPRKLRTIEGQVYELVPTELDVAAPYLWSDGSCYRDDGKTGRGYELILTGLPTAYSLPLTFEP